MLKIPPRASEANHNHVRKSRPGRVFHFVVGHLGGETGFAPIGDVDAAALGGGGAGADGNEVDADAGLEIDEERVELVVGERGGVEDAVAIIVHERDALERRRHRGQETVHHFFADVTAGFAVDERFALFLHVGDFFQQALGAEERSGDFALGFHQGETEIAAVVGVVLRDRHVEQVAAANPTLRGLRAEAFQRRRGVMAEAFDRVFRQAFDGVKQACSDRTTFK